MKHGGSFTDWFVINLNVRLRAEPQIKAPMERSYTHKQLLLYTLAPLSVSLSQQLMLPVEMKSEHKTQQLSKINTKLEAKTIVM